MTEAAELTSGRARNLGIDVLKVLCSAMVVYIHTDIPGIIGYAMYMVSRIAVPVFFMISGYLYPGAVQRGRTGKQLRRMLWLFLLSNLLYFAAEMIRTAASGELAAFLASLARADTWINFIMFNASPFKYHLWYLGAALYTLIVMQFLYRTRFVKVLYYLVPVLLLTDLVFGDYSVVLLGDTFEVFYVRNWLCVGIPYFLIGTLINKHEENIRNRTKVWTWGVLVVVFSMTTLLERLLLLLKDVAGYRSHNASTTLLAVSLFLFCLYFFRQFSGKGRAVSMAAQRYTLWIYILHPIVIAVLDGIARALQVYPAYEWVRFVLVYSVTLTLLLLGNLLLRRMNRRGKTS